VWPISCQPKNWDVGVLQLLESLIEKSKKNEIEVEEVLCDKAYSSKDNQVLSFVKK
jgi:hypothetical protein